jgi:hypothetical protein
MKSVWSKDGAQWHGEWVSRSAEVIDKHRERGDLIDHEIFIKKKFTCYCPECKQKRKRK